MDDSYINTCNASAIGLRVNVMFHCFRLIVSKEFVKQVLLIKLTNCQKVVFAVVLLYVILKNLYS